jgi:hypothetical protein
MAPKKTPSETKVESIRHKDKRTNIPTEELRDFIADDEQAPKTMLYPRDPSLADDVCEIRWIVEYANRIHHDTNPAWQTEFISDSELVGFVRSTLALTRRR